MTNSLFSISDAPTRRREPRPNPHVAELREVFARACHFGLTTAEREEWQARFDNAIAALEAEIGTSARSYTAGGTG
jgi:hypothetical protein